MRKCPFCKYNNQNEQIYCQNCGARLEDEQKSSTHLSANQKRKSGKEKQGNSSLTGTNGECYLVAEARQGKVAQPLERRQLMARLIQILGLTVKNNPLLIGEPGVGKTTLITALAWRILRQRVPENLKNREIVQVNSAYFTKSAGLRGQMETKIEQFFLRAKHLKQIVFIDEIHSLFDSRSYPEAGNAFKPFLLDAQINLIGATTFDGLKKISADPALERRFNPLIVEEPSAEETLEILKHLKPKLEDRYQLTISDQVLTEAIKLAAHYFQEQFFPDKAISLIDSCLAMIATMKTTSLFAGPEFELLRHLSGDSLQREHLCLEVARIKQIPLEKIMSVDFTPEISDLENRLSEMVFGQNAAIVTVSRKIKSAFFFRSNRKRPLAVFLFLGPSGVGKTELAKSLARIIFGDEQNMLRLDMSEYFERHQLARLVGAPPGYIGFEDEGQLTSAVRKTPYAIILLDEIEKAHPDILKLFLQVFDDGRLTDGKGRSTDFSNTIIIMTSNVGRSYFSKFKGAPQIGFQQQEKMFQPTDEKILDPKLLVELGKNFLPEFLNRIDEIVVFQTLGLEILQKIAQSKLEENAASLLERGIKLEWDEQLLKLIVDGSNSQISGAREIGRTVERLVKYPLIDYLLGQGVCKGETVRVETDGCKVGFRVVN